MNNFIFTKLANARKETDQYLKQLIDARKNVRKLEEKVEELENKIQDRRIADYVALLKCLDGVKAPSDDEGFKSCW
jgi:uncharacterized coiled-coil DUF342 family protein